MSEWKEVSLSEMGKTITGKTPSSQYPEDFGDEMPFITPSDSFEKKYINKSDRFLSRSGSDRLKEKIISPNSIMVTCIGSAMGKVAQNSLSSVTNQQINSIIVNENFDSDYIYYLLKNNYAVLRNAASGSTAIPILNKTDFDNLRFKVELNLNEQRKMVSILSKIDDKIEINNQINQELEAMAKTLYDYWFVQFDFPDQNGKPYKSSGGKMVYHPELKREIPEGWGVEKLSSILEIGRETINPMKTPKEEFKYYSIPEYDVSGSFSHELGETIKSNKFLVEKSDLLVSKLNPWFNRVVYNLEESAISSTEFIVWKTINRFEKNFLYQVATSEGFIEYCTRFATGTSNSHKRVSPDIMVSFQIPFEKTYIQKFGEITDSIRAQALQNNEQNQELTQLRDWLLPMLMNGQVKVE